MVGVQVLGVLEMCPLAAVELAVTVAVVGMKDVFGMLTKPLLKRGFVAGPPVTGAGFSFGRTVFFAARPAFDAFSMQMRRSFEENLRKTFS